MNKYIEKLKVKFQLFLLKVNFINDCFLNWLFRDVF